MEDNQFFIEKVIFPTQLPLDHDCCGFESSFGVGASSTTTKTL
jgi:hypothetical protein